MNFLYPELPPRKRFIKIVEAHVMPELAKDGFVFLKSELALKRKEGRFEWTVEFNGHHRNHGKDLCRYNPYFKVANLDYKEYAKANGYANYTDGVVGCTASIQHWDKTTFSTDGSVAYFLENNDFAKHDNPKLVSDMIENIRVVGFPYFRMMSDFDSIKHFYLLHDQRMHAPELIDLCYALDRPDQLKPIFDWYYADNDGCADWLEEEISIRKGRWGKDGSP
jgi:hypothetical protein